MSRRLWIALGLCALGFGLTAVSVAGGQAADQRHPLTCPSHFQRPHFGNYPALHRVMVPRKPGRFVVCRYHGLNAPDPQSLGGSGIVRHGVRLHRVVRIYDALPAPPSGPIACPADWGREIIVDFRYPNRPDDLVRQDLTGCRFGTNGHRSVAMNRRGERLLRLLRRISAD